ncbi:response regulator [Paenibacillus sp. FSL R7-0273]|uniref:response regulator transcription factor n=1 Tax=Paenibacillus sp. FSL R7-0273 TaxID=1536772 RepID=UPI00063F6742|nr:response regulator [Paenibacillus sp. FSL R7-0273]OMF95344.1 hypothetical protein BK144_07455 [Paenibacillus sp. FSL R7-0273]
MYNIILVDDEMGIIEGLKVIIGAYLPECRVIGSANDGTEGYRLILQQCPDIVITDIRMLERDGLEMIESLTAKGVSAKFIILSGYSEFEYARKGMQLGVKSYLTKPIEETELQQCVRKVIREIETARTQEELKRTDALTSSGQTADPEPDPKKRDVIAEIKQYLIENYDQNVSLADLSSRFYLHLNYLSSLFKEKTGQTYLEYVSMIRIEKAKQLLADSELKIYEVGQKVGYYDTTHFSKVFEKIAGCKPSEYRRMQQKR